MRIAYFDCIAGASGDMILGALVDAGLPIETLRQQLACLHMDGFEVMSRRVTKQGFTATKVDVHVAKDAPPRHVPDIEAIVTNSDLATSIKERAVSIFRRIGTAEAAIHGMSLEQVHLHEMGGVDTIVDVVGALAGLEALGVEQVFASPLPMGRGWTQGAHGRIPLPAPATLALLKDVPVVGSPLEAELVTPTGAALLSALVSSFGPVPPMTLSAVGYGAGARDLPIPNLLRVLIGAGADASTAVTEALVMLETNIDDMNPEFYDHAMARLFEGGALDVFLTPAQMKKNRPATLLRVLCRPTDTDRVISILFSETTTLGIRENAVQRHCMMREIDSVETPYGRVHVKVARLGKGRARVKPEYDDCRRLAEQSGVPLHDVYRAAELAAQQMES